MRTVGSVSVEVEETTLVDQFMERTGSSVSSLVTWEYDSGVERRPIDSMHRFTKSFVFLRSSFASADAVDKQDRMIEVDDRKGNDPLFRSG
jgi:hypothetical protein